MKGLSLTVILTIVVLLIGWDFGRGVLPSLTGRGDGLRAR